MSLNYRYNPDRPRLSDCASGGRDLNISCYFCGCRDLRVGGHRVATFLACPKCGADGPIGKGLPEAVHLYTNPQKGKS